ncbi:MAG: hypothetical protein WAM79_22170 [Candidatus Sulfotelmatobacter sp.]
MEGLTSLVSESLARHGFDRPLDYRRLKWSRWFRCESHHSLLFVPSKPGVFAMAEEIVSLEIDRVGTAASAVERTLSEAKGSIAEAERNSSSAEHQGGPAPSARSSYQGAGSAVPSVDANGFAALAAADAENRKPEARSRMLAVSQFFEADDMAFVLDRMLSRQHPMRSRLESGRYFIRFVVIEENSQRRSIASALNQWIANSAEKATGIGPHFATSLELTSAMEPADAGTIPTQVAIAASAVQRTLSEAKGNVGTAVGCPASGASVSSATLSATPPDAPGAATNISSPSPFPSGF